MYTTSQRKLQIFVSSTYTDLLEDRQAAVSAILKAGHIPAGMELFTAGDRSQLDTIKRWIDESDIFMLILGGRYGSIEPNSGLSYTELEYDYAVTQGKPFFAVVIQQQALDARIKKVGSKVLELKEPQKLTAFRDKVVSKECDFFSDAKDIMLAVHNSIPDLETRHSVVGWIRASSVPDATGLINEISRVTEENRDLASKLESARQAALGRSAQAKISRQNMLPVMRPLAHESIGGFVEYDVREHERERFNHYQKRMRESVPFLSKGFPELGRITRYNELTLFYVLAFKFVKGISKWSNHDTELEFKLIEYSIERWILQDLIQGKDSTYRIAPTGKKLFQILSRSEQTIKAQSAMSE